MKLRWKYEGDDWIVQVSGTLRWSDSGREPISRLRDEAQRFHREGKGRAILDLAQLTEADPRFVVELLDVFRELRVARRMHLQGRTSPVASLVAPSDLPWVDGPPAPGPVTPKVSQERAEWDQLAGAAASDATESVDPEDRAPFTASPQEPGNDEKATRRSTEQLSAPLLWFDEGLLDMVPPAAVPPAADPASRSTGSSATSPQRSGSSEQDVFEWFFSMGEAAVREDERARRGRTGNPTAGNAGSENTPVLASGGSTETPVAPRPTGERPKVAPRPLPEFTPVGEESESFEAFGFPTLDELDRSGSEILYDNILSKGRPGDAKRAAASEEATDEATAGDHVADETAPAAKASKMIVDRPEVTASPGATSASTPAAPELTEAAPSVAPAASRDVIIPAPQSSRALEDTAAPLVEETASPTGGPADLASDDDADFSDTADEPASFPLFGDPLPDEGADEAALLAPEVAGDEIIEDAGEDFVIDLELEEMYLTRSPTSRDRIHDARTVEFKSTWSPLTKGDEVVRSKKPVSPGTVDPVSLLLGGGHPLPERNAVPESSATPSPAAPASGAPAPAPTTPYGATGAGTPSSPAPTPDAEQVARSIVAAIPGGGGASANRTDAMTRAIAELIENFAAQEPIASAHDAELDTLRETVASQQAEIDALRAAASDPSVSTATIASAAASLLPEDAAGWWTAFLAPPTNPEPYRARYTSSIACFRASGAVEPHRVLADIAEFDRNAPRIAAAVGAMLEKQSGTPGDGWRALLLVLSTLVREGVSPERRRRGLRVAWLASLVRSAPGSETTDLEFIGSAVARLLSGPTYRFPDEGAIDAHELRSDAELWHACTRLDLHRHLLPKRWRGVVGRTLAKYEDDEAVRGGLARLVEAHSLYFPGVWVELTTGGIGPVIGANPGRPEFPRVLILFRRQGMRGERVPPQVSPAGAIASAGVLRLLSQPHVAEKEGNTLAIDTGGSTYVPKNG